MAARRLDDGGDVLRQQHVARREARAKGRACAAEEGGAVGLAVASARAEEQGQVSARAGACEGGAGGAR